MKTSHVGFGSYNIARPHLKIVSWNLFNSSLAIIVEPRKPPDLLEVALDKCLSDYPRDDVVQNLLVFRVSNIVQIDLIGVLDRNHGMYSVIVTGLKALWLINSLKSQDVIPVS